VLAATMPFRVMATKGDVCLAFAARMRLMRPLQRSRQWGPAAPNRSTKAGLLEARVPAFKVPDQEGRVMVNFGTHKGHQCQEGVRTWPGDYARRRAGLIILLDLSSQVPGLLAARPGVRLERPQPRSGEDERA
jgi:hypothetical protein